MQSPPTGYEKGANVLEYNIAVIKGDGIGPEIVTQAENVMAAAGKKFGHTFHFRDVLMGGCAIDKTGTPLPPETVGICRKSDSVLLGAVGGPKWDTLPGDKRPEKGLLGIRSALGLFANLRPAVLFPSLKNACPLKSAFVKSGIDLIIVRELTGGIYFGERGRKPGKLGDGAYDTEMYSVGEVERIGRLAFREAKQRRHKVTSIDKANVLESSRLWRSVMHRLAAENPDVEYSDMLVDNAAMQLVRNPGQFDVIVTTNMFGDILSDEASMATGSIGMLPSASLGEGTRGLYEPIHGSAPDIAGQNKANPIATILSAAMMMRMSFHLEAEAKAIENAVSKAFEKGLRTPDISDGSAGEKIVGTREMGTAIASLV